MINYFYSIIGIILLSSIILAILPEGKTYSIILFFVKLSCLIIIVSPLINLTKNKDLKKIFNFSNDLVIETDESFINYFCTQRIRETELSIKNHVKETYTLDCNVTLSYQSDNYGNILINEISIIIKSQTGEYNKMKDELQQLYGTKVVIKSG